MSQAIHLGVAARSFRPVFLGLIGLSAVACAAFRSSPVQAPHTADLGSPSTSDALIILPNGRAFRIWGWGSILGAGRVSLGTFLSYRSCANSFEELEIESRMLFRFILPLAEREHRTGILISADFGADADGRPVRWNTPYKLNNEGVWVPKKPTQEEKMSIRSRYRCSVPTMNILASVQDAQANASRILAELDLGEYQSVLNNASKRVSTDFWRTKNSRDHKACSVAREYVLALYYGSRDDLAMQGDYVEVRYQSNCGNDAPATERILLERKKPREWKLVGYDLVP